MTLLTDLDLEIELRVRGYQALLWHDVLEDTNLPLPDDTSDDVRALVNELTFNSFREERGLIWGKSTEAKLLKAYDKVSNLLDGRWMNTQKWNVNVEYTERLLDYVAVHYGELNIVRIGRAVCLAKSE